MIPNRYGFSCCNMRNVSSGFVKSTAIVTAIAANKKGVKQVIGLSYFDTENYLD